MPVVINDVAIELEDAAANSNPPPPAQTQSPVSDPEHELLAMLALIEERRRRLAID